MSRHLCCCSVGTAACLQVDVAGRRTESRHSLQLLTPAGGGGGLWIFPYVSPKRFPLLLAWPAESFGCFHFIYSVEHKRTRGRLKQIGTPTRCFCRHSTSFVCSEGGKNWKRWTCCCWKELCWISNHDWLATVFWGKVLHSHWVELTCAPWLWIVRSLRKKKHYKPNRF